MMVSFTGGQKTPEIWVPRDRNSTAQTRVSKNCGYFFRPQAWCEAKFRIWQVLLGANRQPPSPGHVE